MISMLRMGEIPSDEICSADDIRLWRIMVWLRHDWILGSMWFWRLDMTRGQGSRQDKQFAPVGVCGYARERIAQ